MERHGSLDLGSEHALATRGRSQLLDDGHQVRHEILRGWWIDTGKKDPLLHCNRLVLDTIEHRVDGHVDDQSRVERRVVIEEGVQLIRSVVRGPAIIGARTRLVDTYVGPYTSIGANVELEGIEIEHSIVLDGARMRFIAPRVEGSLIGPRARVTRDFDMPRAVRLAIGEGAQVSFAA